MILAVSPEGVIGLHGGIPWRHPGDMRRFARVTRGSTVIMGRLTWESMKGRPLPHRRNLVVTSRPLEGVETFPSLAAAIAAAEGDVWLIGGRAIYDEGMRFCDVIDVTYVPDRVDHPDAVRAPAIDPAVWDAGPLVPHEEEPGLVRRVYTRKVPREV
jgi:dihydrofolate reductase